MNKSELEWTDKQIRGDSNLMQLFKPQKVIEDGSGIVFRYRISSKEIIPESDEPIIYLTDIYFYISDNISLASAKNIKLDNNSKELVFFREGGAYTRKTSLYGYAKTGALSIKRISDGYVISANLSIIGRDPLWEKVFERQIIFSDVIFKSTITKTEKSIP